jgi:IS30 family transposase
MKSYIQLTEEKRYQISAYKKAGYKQCEIAVLIGMDKSTVSRELKRNQGLRGYRPKQAQQLALQRQNDKVAERIKPEVWDCVKTLLEEDWSPEQISGWLKKVKRLSVSHESIYQYVYRDKSEGGDLYRHLRCQRKRKKRYGSHSTRGMIPGRVSIDERPAVVDRKNRYGDWELDTVIGKNHHQAIVTITERKSKLALFKKVERKTADLVRDAIIGLLEPIKDYVKTLTADNGKEFAAHITLAKELEADFYFAHPYASWERGLNENTNGLLRQYFPKKTDFRQVSEIEINKAMEKLNNRPRKTLGYKTPNEIFFGIKPSVALAI